MLKYYSYYSVGGYKDLYLGSSEDKVEATYYLPLLPLMEDNTIQEDPNKVESLKGLPKIKLINNTESHGLPNEAKRLFSHAGYKILYKNISAKTYALAIRDIPSSGKDESGRSIPFLLVIIGTTQEDIRILNILTTFLASYIPESEKVISSCLGYDQDVNGLRFEISRFNKWIEDIISGDNSNRIATEKGILNVEGKPGKTAFILLPSEIDIEYAVQEQNLSSPINSYTNMNELIQKNDTERLVCLLDETTRQLKEEQGKTARLKKYIVAAGIGGLIAGAAMSSCAGK